ncbi:MAG: hypothetical protein JW741_30095 [Sedimentisphaerales bacterium]|nr:hypothetical protein [Sedimentisphaerales bacterium]
MTAAETRSAQTHSKMLAVNADFSLMQPFFDHMAATIDESVKKAVAESLAGLRETFAAERVAPPTASGPGSSADKGVALTPEDQRRAEAVLAHRGLNLNLREGQMLIDSKALAILLGISHRALYRHISTGAVPRSVGIGNMLKRWSLPEMLAWVEQGCPNDERWQRIRKTAMRDYRVPFLCGGR